MNHDPRQPDQDQMEKLLRAMAAEDRADFSERDAAFLRRMNTKIRADRPQRPTPPRARDIRRRRIRRACILGAAAVLLISLLLYIPHRKSPLDGIVYQEGEVDAVSTADGERIISGESSGYVYARAGGAVMLFVGGNTDLAVNRSGQIRLEKGVVWVHVVENPREGTRVETSGGLITMLGTLFSVSVNLDTTVGVTRGRVLVQAADEEAVVTAGRSVHFGGDQAGIQEGPTVGEPPDWVWSLAGSAAGHGWREIYLSGSPHQ